MFSGKDVLTKFIPSLKVGKSFFYEQSCKALPLWFWLWLF